MKNIYTLAAALTALISFCQAGNVTNPQLNKIAFVTFEKVELSFGVDQTYAQPNDPEIVAVDAEVTLPGGSTLIVPCFFFVPVTFQESSPTFWNATENDAQKQWKLRYSPTVPGAYSVRVRINDGATTWSAPIAFNVTQGNAKGFVRIDSDNKQFLRFDNQDPYYPVGHNLCWNSGTLTKFYDDWITDRLAPNRVNWTRYWLTDFARQALEWSPSHWSGWYGGLGAYSQKAAGLLDDVISSHEANGIYMQLVLQHHGQFSTNVNPEWDGNPYNTANGGFLSQPGDFFTNAQAKEQTKKLYRYIVARWGYSQAILSWELFNEVEFTGGTDAGIDAWHDEMSQYLKSIDVNRHLVSTSSGGDDSTIPLMEDNVDMDVLQWHTYSNQIEKAIYTRIPAFAALGKSTMNGEFGTGIAYPTDGSHPDNWGDHVRKAMWISMMSASPAMFWFWDTYIEIKNLSSVFKPLATFLEGVDLAKTNNGTPEKLRFASAPSVSGSVTVVPGVSDFGATNVPNPFISTVSADGVASNQTTLNTFIQGSYQGNRNRDLSFTLNFVESGSASLVVSGFSTYGTKGFEVSVDGGTVTNWDITSAQTYTLNNIPAGTHTVRFNNTGQDWVQFSQIVFTGTSPTYSVEAFGYTGVENAYGYINNLAYGDWAAPQTIAEVSDASLEIEGLQPGNYKVTFFDPVTGSSLPVTNITHDPDELPDGRTNALAPLILELPDFTKDLAYKVEFSSSLPVHLISISGEALEDDIRLNWSVTDQVNNKGYVIERSLDSRNFKPIGFVEGNGDQAALTTESFVDKDILGGKTYYYRLEQQDFDGSSALSKIIAVKSNGRENGQHVYPNPNHGNFTLELPDANNKTIKMFSINGIEIPVNREIKSGNVVIQAKGKVVPGVYYLKISSGLEKNTFNVVIH
ncbi:T9SS type A sorting domain-containing protein [Dyadobacter arcticus]|uniref:Por secretion system C-terminal sorting domain-containing protein n=1 Tax=Dyadobacter arcticus TaxID=1078754 RepID=A0ABX0UNM9_9BACT|nr:T9SS type A sorting domain-containing protein [Dyadobacter arcticus]NIJ54589.1 hypothetical protein [Dyadobacter arcticus]